MRCCGLGAGPRSGYSRRERNPGDSMNKPLRTELRSYTSPHDCPSTCALEVEVLDGRSIGRVRGAADNLYTAGVICAKVARYAERIHHPDRLLHPLIRT